MKAVFVSDVSPARGHVFGLRVASFAAGLARRGHSVIVLGPTRDAGEPGTEPEALALALKQHDWSKPLNVSRRPQTSYLLDTMRRGRLNPALRRSLTVLMLATQGGVHGDWVAGAQPLIGPLAEKFRPEIVWAVFGHTSNLVLGQILARHARASWLMDFKDNWETYVRPGLRGLMAHRFRDAAGFTSNAQFHGDIAARWHRQPHAVIQSSVGPEMIAPEGAVPRHDAFVLTLIGSIYDAAKLARFLVSLNRWLETLLPAERAVVEFHYAGAAAGDVGQTLAALPLGCRTRVDRNLPHAALARLCHDAAANCYLWAPFGFHHKLLELIACRRLVISFPGEHEESKELARKVGGALAACFDENELVAAFDLAFRRWQAGDAVTAAVDTTAFTWDAMAAKLEAFMLGFVENDPRRLGTNSANGARR